MRTNKLECQKCDWHYYLSPAAPLDDELGYATALFTVHIILVHPDFVELVKAHAEEFREAIMEGRRKN